MEQEYWQLGKWKRIPISMHWTVLLNFAWLYLFLWNLLATAIASAALVALYLAHEFGHVAILRRKKISIHGIQLFGLHGRTLHGYASPANEILVAWGGVAAQAAILVLSSAAGYLVDFSSHPLAVAVTAPILFVFTKLNLVLIVVALLPIGPFDGHAAWAVISKLRKAIRKRNQPKGEVMFFPERRLSPKRRQELEEASSKAAAELIGKLNKKDADRKEDI